MRKPVTAASGSAVCTGSTGAGLGLLLGPARALPLSKQPPCIVSCSLPRVAAAPGLALQALLTMAAALEELQKDPGEVKVLLEKTARKRVHDALTFESPRWRRKSRPRCH